MNDAMKRHKIIFPMLGKRELQFWTIINLEIEYFLNKETESVLTDTVINQSISVFKTIHDVAIKVPRQ